MLKKMMTMTVLFAGVIGCAQAVTAQTAGAPVGVAAPIAATPGIANPHQSRDAIFLACKIDADNKKLVGTARNAAISTCLKTPR